MVAMSARSSLLVCVCALAAQALIACASHVYVARPPELDTGTFGPFQRCTVGYGACQPDETFDSARMQAAGTRYFRLPDCPYGIQDLFVQDAHSSEAELLVRCAAPKRQPAAGGGLPVTAADGGLSVEPASGPKPREERDDAQLP